MPSMMTADELRDLCLALRRGKLVCDDKLISAIEADLEEYRLAQVEQLPPDHLAERLPLMGWLIYEATWSALQQITDGRREQNSEVLAQLEAYREMIVRAANAARKMPWPEYAGRALGAFRCQALAESKLDTEDGYDRAQMTHRTARSRYGEFLSYHHARDAQEKDPYLRALDEVLVQLALAETGTACRVSERIIGLWAEEFPSKSQTEYAQRMFDQLTTGADIGKEALDAADRVKQNHGFVDEVSAEGLALPTSFINPGIMTARALLLMLALSAKMEELGRFPLGEDDTWDQTRGRLRDRFDEAYEYIERPIEDSQGNQREPRSELKLAIVQIRLSAALLIPGHRLPSARTFAPCMAHEVLDEEAVESMCNWLAEPVDDTLGGQKQRSVLRGIGSAIMPDLIDSVEACRVAFDGRPGFREWRARWFALDAYAHENGRADRVEKVLSLPVRRADAI